jgi:hypothetical protein
LHTNNLQDPAFDGLASEKIGVTKLNFRKDVFKLEVFYYAKIVEVQKFSGFSVLRIFRHLPFLPNLLNSSLRALILIKLAEKIIGHRAFKKNRDQKRSSKHRSVTLTS